MDKTLNQILEENKVTIEENTHNVLEYGKVNVYGVSPEDFSSIRHYSSTSNTLDYDAAYSDYDVFEDGNIVLSCAGADEVDQYIKNIISKYIKTIDDNNSLSESEAQSDDVLYLNRVKNLIVWQLLNGTSSIDDSHVERILSNDSLETEEFSLVFDLDDVKMEGQKICSIETGEYSGNENEYVIDLYIDQYLYERDQMEVMDLYIYKALADELAKIELRLSSIQGK